MSDRIRTILSAGDSAGLPEIARVLALDSDIAPEAAETVFAAAKKDIAAVTASAGDTITTPLAGGQNSGNLVGHNLGVADLVGGQGQAAAKAAWGKAVAQVNASRFGDAVN